MALLLEFFILFFGILWLAGRKAYGSLNVLSVNLSQEEFCERSRGFQKSNEATPDEYKIAEWVIQSGVTYNPETFEYELSKRFDQENDPSYEKRSLYRRIKDYPGLHASDFASLILDDIEYIFGYGSFIITNGKYTPINDIHFRYKDGDRFLFYHGHKLMTMLILAKMGKIPPYPRYGSTVDIETADDTEMLFLERIEQTLRSHGVRADFVLTAQYGQTRHFRHRQNTIYNKGEKEW